MRAPWRFPGICLGHQLLDEVLGLQFHAEITHGLLAEWLAAFNRLARLIYDAFRSLL